ncbi:hypothetical protein ABW19_dt0208480 [Dactylella cylindrospora]|nr:hypothetical protein ABW19_dt0208480 [Dactylella cylindrospora]
MNDPHMAYMPSFVSSASTNPDSFHFPFGAPEIPAQTTEQSYQFPTSGPTGGPLLSSHLIVEQSLSNVTPAVGSHAAIRPNQAIRNRILNTTLQRASDARLPLISTGSSATENPSSYLQNASASRQEYQGPMRKTPTPASTTTSSSRRSGNTMPSTLATSTSEPVPTVDSDDQLKLTVLIQRKPAVRPSREAAPHVKSLKFRNFAEVETEFEKQLETQFHDPMFNWRDWQFQTRTSAIITDISGILDELDFYRTESGTAKVSLFLVPKVSSRRVA